jgi:hypothetical protein
MNQIDPNFDWVTARANCTPSGVLGVLKAQVQADVERRNSLRTSEELQYDIKFGFEVSSLAFKVSRVRMGEILESVVLSQQNEGISVDYKKGMMNSYSGLATLTLSNEGECKLKTVDGQEHSFWQFRKSTLEPIFFSNNFGW